MLFTIVTNILIWFFDRLTEQKEKRNIEKKLKSVKLLTEDSDHEDDAKSWVVKLRQKEIEKKKAEQRVRE